MIYPLHVCTRGVAIASSTILFSNNPDNYSLSTLGLFLSAQYLQFFFYAQHPLRQQYTAEPQSRYLR